MPIKRFEPTGTVVARWTHEIISPDFKGKLKSVREKIADCEPQIHWTMGHRLDKVRETCSMRGWEFIDLRDKVAKK